MSIGEVLYPFSLSADGGIASTGDNPQLQAQQHVDALVSTTPGERVMLPTYGVPLKSSLFLGDLSAITASLTTDVTVAMGDWEPSIAVQRVAPLVSDRSEGTVVIDVDYTVGDNPLSLSNVNTATVEVGGNVVEIIRSQVNE